MKAFPPKNPTGGTVTGGDPSSSAAYSPTGASYGCSLGARNWAKATGAITTVYIWVPSTIPDPNNPTTQIPDPLDVAPTQVISVETCTAHANGQSYFPLGTSATASCSNGLGFNSTDWSGPPLSGNWPYGVIIGVGATSDSTGTLYTSRAGGATITLTCSPTADARVDANGAGTFVSIAYTSSIIVPSIQIAGTTRINNTNKVLTGQQLQASVVATGLTIVPTSYVWSVTGADPFKDYIATTSQGMRVDLVTPITTASVSYYTNLGEPNDVTCAVEFDLPTGAKFAGGLPAFSLPHQVVTSVRPTGKFNVDSGTIKWGLPQVAYGL